MGLFQYTRLPQGLSNSAQTFQLIMEAVLYGLTWHSCAVYIDDVIIFEGQTFNEHLHAIEEVFRRPNQANLKLKQKKCQFAKRNVKFLGQIISTDGIRTDPDKMEVVKPYPVFKNIKDLRSFVGLVNYYRKFCINLSKIAIPFNNLLKQNVPFVWSYYCLNAFDSVKDTLVTAPMLRYPDLNTPFKLYCDASGFSVDAVLCQDFEGKEHVVSYAGRSLSKEERNAASTHKEC